MKRLTLLAIFAACGLASAAPDLGKGKQAAMVCSGCHMVDGNSTIAMYPKIAGQHSDYIFKQMLDIKKGERKTGNSAVMAPIVQNMSEADMHNIAAYFATQQAKAGEANPKANPEATRTELEALAERLTALTARINTSYKQSLSQRRARRQKATGTEKPKEVSLSTN